MGIAGVMLNKFDIINAIHAAGGIIKHAALRMGCDSSTIYLWMDRDKDVEQAVKDSRKKREQSYIDNDLELVEAARKVLLRSMENDTNVNAATFVAKTKGKFETPVDSSTRVTVNIDNS